MAHARFGSSMRQSHGSRFPGRTIRSTDNSKRTPARKSVLIYILATRRGYPYECPHPLTIMNIYTDFRADIRVQIICKTDSSIRVRGTTDILYIKRMGIPNNILMPAKFYRYTVVNSFLDIKSKGLSTYRILYTNTVYHTPEKYFNQTTSKEIEHLVPQIETRVIFSVTVRQKRPKERNE